MRNVPSHDSIRVICNYNSHRAARPIASHTTTRPTALVRLRVGGAKTHRTFSGDDERCGHAFECTGEGGQPMVCTAIPGPGRPCVQVSGATSGSTQSGGSAYLSSSRAPPATQGARRWSAKGAAAARAANSAFSVGRPGSDTCLPRCSCCLPCSRPAACCPVAGPVAMRCRTLPGRARRAQPGPALHLSRHRGRAGSRHGARASTLAFGGAKGHRALRSAPLPEVPTTTAQAATVAAGFPVLDPLTSPLQSIARSRRACRRGRIRRGWTQSSQGAPVEQR
jgi:hypothetical protein